jgi:hypothetical protein
MWEYVHISNIAMTPDHRALANLPPLPRDFVARALFVVRDALLRFGRQGIGERRDPLVMIPLLFLGATVLLGGGTVIVVAVRKGLDDIVIGIRWNVRHWCGLFGLWVENVRRGEVGGKD